jgi:hypothetical protein
LSISDIAFELRDDDSLEQWWHFDKAGEFDAAILV